MSKAPKTPFTRNSIACEYCRARRKKCQPPFPCRACRDAGIPDCKVRELARPQRKIQRTGSAIAGTQNGDRARTIDTIEEYLEDIYLQQTGRKISLALNETPLHPLCDLSLPLTAPLPPLPHPPDASVFQAITTFLDHLLKYAGYISRSRIDDLFQRWLVAPDRLPPDQRALILTAIASGYVRLQSRGPAGELLHVNPEERRDVLYFRHAVRTLEEWGSASFTSLHALAALWAYSIMTCPSSTICKLAKWLVAQATELNIHQDEAPVAYGPADRADLMLIKVLYAHYWATALTSHPPVIRPEELEQTVVRARPVPGHDEDSIALVPRRSLSELLLFNTKLLVTLHDPRTPALTIEWLNETEEQWDMWCSRWIAEGRTTGSRRTDPFLNILWDWGRITLRTPTLGDRRLAGSSIAILARSATKILSAVHTFYSGSADDVNMVWQHLRCVVTCAHIVLLAFWRYELREREAADSLRQALDVLADMQVRWGNQVADAVVNIYALAAGLGVHIKRPDEAASGPASELEMPPDSLAGLTNFDFLYEAFNPMDSMPSTMQWTLDTILFAQDPPSSVSAPGSTEPI